MPTNRDFTDGAGPVLQPHPPNVSLRKSHQDQLGITENPKRLDAAGGAIPAGAFRESIR